MPDGAFSMERVVFPVLAEDGELSGFPFEGHFVDAGTPASYIEAIQTSIQNESWISIRHREYISPAELMPSYRRTERCTVLGHIGLYNGSG